MLLVWKGSIVYNWFMKNKRYHNLTSQQIQDNIFRKMSADRKVEIGSQLWEMAKDIVGDKINYARNNRPETPARSHR
jgi:hypothetical protein